MVSRAGKKKTGTNKIEPTEKKGVGRAKRDEQAEKEKHIELEKYRILFESFPLGITITDAEGNIVEANMESERLLGIRRSEQLQRRYDGPEWKIIRPDGTPMPPDEYASVRALKEKRRIENVEMGIVKNGGEITWINVTAEPIPLENFGVAITYGDISARKTLEENLEKQRREFKHIIDSAPIIIFYKDLAGRMIRVNKTFSEALKLSEDEILGKTVFDIYSTPIAQAMTDDDQEVLRTGRPKLNIEEPYESATGIRWVRTDKVPITDDNGITIGLVGFAQDITERKFAEQALQESEKRVKAKLDAILAPQGDIGQLELADILDIDAIQSIMDDFYKLTNVSAWILDIKGKILVSTGWRDICTRFHRVNPETCKNCVESDTQLSNGVPPGTFKIYKCKNNMWDLVTPIVIGDKHIGNLFMGQFIFDDETVDDALFRTQARRYGFDEEEYLAALESVPRLSRQTLDSAMAFYSKFAHMISTLSHNNIQLARSLTEKDRLLTALKESEEKYRTLFDQAPVGIALTTTDGRVIELNNAQAEMMGYTVQELRGEKAIDYYADPEKRKYIEEVVQKNGKLHDVEVELKKKDGSILVEILNFDLLQLAGSNFLLVTGRDVTRLRQAEKAVRESEALYRLLAEHTTDFVWLMDMNLNPTYQSPSAEKLTGYTYEELMTLPFEKRLTPDSLKAAADMFFQEIPRVMEDKNYNPVRTLELEILCKDGSTLWSENKFSVIRDENSKAVSILGEAREITKRREAEKKLENTLAALEKTLSDTVIAISRIVEMKDPFTAGHQMRVAQLAGAMARKMNLSDEEAYILNTAATIHDIGKIYVPSDILSKPGKLNPLEYEIIQTHVRGSYDILKDIKFNGPIAQIVYQHHERMDGSGYPLGLKASDILPLAKILIVADVVEAMSSHRPYRAAMGISKALEEIMNNRGKLYDEAAVDVCLELFHNNEFSFKSA